MLYNPDNVAACGVKLAPANSTGQLMDFWPDWAPKAEYEVYYNPHQVQMEIRKKNVSIVGMCIYI